MVPILIHLETDGECFAEQKEFTEIPLKDTGKIQSKSPRDGLVIWVGAQACMTCSRYVQSV